MGLHLCYELSLPRDTAEAEVARHIAALREHLLRCHGSLVALLDAAGASGFEVVVRNETGYRESRDPRQLEDAAEAMNRIVARFAGGLTDTVRDAGGDGRAVDAPIFEHPEFERLEGD